MVRFNPSYPYSTTRWDPLAELTHLQRALSSAFDSRGARRQMEFPALNVAADDSEAVLTAELPGVDPADLEVTVHGAMVTIKGVRGAAPVAEGEQYHRRERETGAFSRSLELPYNLDPDKVQASLKHGVLTVVLPRAETDKPRKVQIGS